MELSIEFSADKPMHLGYLQKREGLHLEVRVVR